MPICRNADSGSQSQLDNLILQGEPMDPSIQENYVELTMEGMLEQTAFYHTGGLFGQPSDSYAWAIPCLPIFKIWTRSPASPPP